MTNTLQKHYCDYCDVFLTHDSASGEHTTVCGSHTDTHDNLPVRKAHNNGRNHLANVRDYYACMSCIHFVSSLTDGMTALGHDKAQSIIDQITATYESSGGPPPGGFGFGPQHLAPPPPFGGPMGGMGGPPPGFGGAY